MPNNNGPAQPRFGALRRIADRVQNNTDSLYKSTYYSDNSNKRQLQGIKTSINGTIKDIMDTSQDNIGEPNISKLYERLLMAQNDPETLNDFDQIFGDNEFVSNLAASYTDNRWVKEIDTETDEVLRYMPKLQEALDVMRDNVLSADSFSKDFLNLNSHLTGMDSKQSEQFSRNVDDMKQRYDLSKLTKRLYEETSKYGECFVYCVPYTAAIQRLMDNKGKYDQMAVRTNFGESCVELSVDGRVDSVVGLTESYNQHEGGLNIDMTYEKGIISSIVRDEQKMRDNAKKVRQESLTESYLEQCINEGEIDVSARNTGFAMDRNVFDNDLQMGEKLPTHHHFDKTLDDDLELPNYNDTTADGFTDVKKRNTKIKDMNGCIVKILKRDKVVPIMLNDVCLGYYYFEVDPNQEIFDDRRGTTGMVNTITGLRSNGSAEAFDSVSHREDLLRSVSGQLADRISPEFINNNQDLKKEIYYILKYNDDYNAMAISNNNIHVSYIPPEDIHHFYFDLDEETGRGLSDLELSMIPAKLWVAIYITNCLAVMTRSNDKRVYYVRQSVETNISKTLLKTIDEIKKSNFGIRQIENINSVLNITGRFNDYIIPRGSDGQSPIDFEVMQGQQVEIKTDLLNLLEESAINVTGVPIEIIQSRQSPDYAMQLTMSNSKFLRFVYDRQSEFQKLLDPLFSKIYNIEYTTSIGINVVLPPPLFINVTNTNQLIVNTRDYCQNITDIVMADETDDSKKQRFLRELTIYHLGPYFNMDTIEMIKNRAEQETVKDRISNPENMEGGE